MTFYATWADSPQDAAAAALFAACKIEDTLKKSRDILCAAYNLKVSPPEHLSPDDTVSHNSLRIPGRWLSANLFPALRNSLTLYYWP